MTDSLSMKEKTFLRMEVSQRARKGQALLTAAGTLGLTALAPITVFAVGSFVSFNQSRYKLSPAGAMSRS